MGVDGGLFARKDYYMARMEDLPAGEREMLTRLDLPTFESTPFVEIGRAHV